MIESVAIVKNTNNLSQVSGYDTNRKSRYLQEENVNIVNPGFIDTTSGLLKHSFSNMTGTKL